MEPLEGIDIQLDGPRREQLQKAIKKAFPRYKLEQMISFQFDENLEAIAGGENYDAVVFNLIRWAEAEGNLNKLLSAALRTNPGNRQLREFAIQVGIISKPSPIPIKSVTKRAVRNLKKLFNKRYALVFILMTVGIAISINLVYSRQILIPVLGDLLQTLEFKTYDKFMQTRWASTLDNYILIVEITDKYTQKDGKLSDGDLLKALQKLDESEPRPVAIGLDTFRDLPTSNEDRTSHNGLIEYIGKHSDHIVPICLTKSDTPTKKPGATPVLPKGKEKEVSQIFSFSDIPEDKDGVIRRQLLTQTYREIQPLCATPYSLSYKLAGSYLQIKNYKFTRSGDSRDSIEIIGNGTKTTLKELRRQGPYGDQPWGGYQMLVNYRCPVGVEGDFEKVPIDSIIDGQQLEKAKERIVLIGYTSTDKTVNSEDLHAATCFSSQGTGNVVPGVIIQAHMVSQILYAVLHNRPLVGMWPTWAEFLWLSLWSAVGGLIVWVFRATPFVFGIAISALIALLVICWFLLNVWGWWLPFISSTVTFICSSLAVRAYVINRV